MYNKFEYLKYGTAMNPKEQETNALIERIQKTIDLYKKNNKIKFSWSRLASNIGLTPQAATNWKRGIISKDALQKIADFTGVDYYWLLTGKGTANAQTVKNFGIVASTGLAAATFGPIGAGAAALTVNLIDNRIQKKEAEEISKINIDKFQTIRLIPKIDFEVLSNNLTTLIQNQNLDFAVTKLNELGENSFATTIVDNAMSPIFEIGDEIIIDSHAIPTPECYVLAIYNDSKPILRKFYELTPTKFKLIALKEGHADYEEQDKINILGKVVQHTKKIK